jgi:hypothetical protein
MTEVAPLLCTAFQVTSSNIDRRKVKRVPTARPPDRMRCFALRRRCGCALALLAASMMAASTVEARQNATVANAPTAIFAGVGYLASLSGVPKLFPYTWQIDSLAELSGDGLSRRFFRSLEKAGVHLSSDLAPRPGIAFALAFDGETTLRERLANHGRVVVEISAQLLAYDFSEQQVLAAFPVFIDRVDIIPDAMVTGYETRMRDTLFQLVTSEDRPSLLSLAAASYSRLRVRDGLPCKIQVEQVTLDSSVRRIRVGHFEDDSAVGRKLSDLFVRSWITATQYPLLPSGRTHVVGNTMALRFSDGRTVELKIPAPDYVIVLDSARTRRQTVASSVAGRTDAVGAFVTFSVQEPLSHTTIASASFKEVLADKVPALQTTVDEWPAAQGVFESLFVGFANAVRQGDTKWFSQHAVSSNGSQAGVQFHTWLSSKCALSH